MGAHRPRGRTAPRLRPLTAADEPGVPDRLYGRRRGHALRPRQQRLLDTTLPRLRLAEAAAADPLAAFGGAVDAVELEVGFGGGEHTLARIAAAPRTGLIASEVFENGLCALLGRLVPEGGKEGGKEGGEEDCEATAPLPANLLLWPADARRLLPLLPAGSLARLFLMFPDPWPKARHAKRRFVHPATLPAIARVLRPGGAWRIATDDPTYQEWVRAVIGHSPLFALGEAATARPDGWPSTRYEAKAVAAGRRPLWWQAARLGPVDQ